ncbi:excalibur calcium-binding domain-containing protein [Nocardia cyriacigeorgica]|uniref:excalibur calcium-binding domain-containing protein n=1 Tax=Nocardia cyriacigeorgica TaxID=135487 RepID=UPI0032AEB3F3
MQRQDLCLSMKAPSARPKGLSHFLAPEAAAPGVAYKNCDAARDAAVAPLRRDDSGYAPHLDRRQ